MLKSGMIVAESVMGRNQSLLFEQGKTLTELDLKKLRQWGISEVNIESDKDALSSNSENELEIDPLLETFLSDHFHNVDLEHPFGKQLYFCCAHWFQKKHQGTNE